MRLNRWDRKRIIDKVTEATFGAKKEAREEREHALAEKIIQALLTPEERKLLEKIPMKWLAHRVSYFYVKKDDEGSSNYEQLNFGKDTKVPDFIPSGTHIVSDELFAEVAEYRAYARELAQEEKDFKVKTEGVIQTFTSAEKLLAHWPTLRELMGEKFFENAPPPSLPVTVIDELDKALQGARPFDAVPA